MEVYSNWQGKARQGNGMKIKYTTQYNNITVFAMAAAASGSSGISFSCVVASPTTSQSSADVSFSIHNTFSICDWLYFFSDSMTLISQCVVTGARTGSGGGGGVVVVVIAGFILLLWIVPLAVVWRFELIRMLIFNYRARLDRTTDWIYNDVHDAQPHSSPINIDLINLCLFIW